MPSATDPSRQMVTGGSRVGGVTGDGVRLGEVDGGADANGLRSGEVDDNIPGSPGDHLFVVPDGDHGKIRLTSCDDAGERSQRRWLRWFI